MSPLTSLSAATSARTRRVRAILGAVLLAAGLISVAAPANAAPNPAGDWNIAFAINWAGDGLTYTDATSVQTDGVSLTHCNGCDYLVSTSVDGVQDVIAVPPAASQPMGDYVPHFDIPSGATATASGSFGNVFTAGATGNLAATLRLACTSGSSAPTGVKLGLFAVDEPMISITSLVASQDFDWAGCDSGSAWPATMTFFDYNIDFGATVTSGSRYAVFVFGPSFYGYQPQAGGFATTTTTTTTTTPPPPGIAPMNWLDDHLAPFYESQTYTDGVSADGNPAPTYFVSAGALPDGISLDPATGALTGSPTAAGAYSFEITATNTSGVLTKLFSGSVSSPTTTTTPSTGAAPSMWVDDLIAGFGEAQPYSDGVAADGIPAPTFAITSGALPDGISLDSATGALTGTPTGSGSYSFEITATNSHGSISLSFVGSITPATTTTTTTIAPTPGTTTTTIAPTPSPTTTMPTPVTTMPTTTTPSPATLPSGGYPQQSPGAHQLLINGTPTTVTVSSTASGLVLSTSGLSLQLTAPVATIAGGTPVAAFSPMAPAGFVMTGLQPGTTAHFWLFSEPTYLGSALVAADGTATASFSVPALPAGNHTLQVNATLADGSASSVNLGVTVTASGLPEDLPDTGSNTSGLQALGMLLLVLGFSLIVSARRPARVRA